MRCFLPLKKQALTLLVACLSASSYSYGQTYNQESTTFTMDLKPVLQLEISDNSDVEFVFDKLTDYSAGIVKYGATTLRISSSVNWDLYAVGTSSGNTGAGYWDHMAAYGNTNPNQVTRLPLSLLELHQSSPNQGASGATGSFRDYSAPFSANGSPSMSNSIYANANTNVPPSSSGKYIAGHAGTSGVPGQDHMIGGSYLMQNNNAQDFFYTIDYRIVPGIPAIFPNASNEEASAFEDLVTVNGVGSYAAPGVYSMNVKYILLEDQ